MSVIYVAHSKMLQAWGADVGLGKALYKLGLVPEGEDPAQILAAGHAGVSDWVLLRAEPAAGLEEDAMYERLARKEKLVDPAYYPRIRGARGIVKVNLQAVENAMRIRLALETGQEPRDIKVKPADVARHLVANALK